MFDIKKGGSFYFRHLETPDVTERTLEGKSGKLSESVILHKSRPLPRLQDPHL